MAEATARIEAGSAALPSAEALFLFLDDLRREGYRIDARHIAAAQWLLAEAHAEGAESLAARRIKFRLAPLIAKSPSQQQDFYRRFDTWQDAPEVASRTEPDAPTATGPAREVVKRDPRRWIIGGTLATFLAFAVLATWYFWPPQPGKAVDLPQERFEITEQVVFPFYAGLKAALAAAPLFAFAAWFLVRWRRRMLLISRGVVLGDAALGSVRLPLKLSDVLFTGPELRASAHGLRKHRHLLTHKLDARRTVDTTARRAGLFTPIYCERPQLPEYVFLIEQNGSNDHLACLFDLAVNRLRDEQVEIQSFYFHTDPRQVQADDRSAIPLAELAARTDDHRLFVIATADGFFHPLTGEVEGWVQRLESWRSRTLLSTRPLEQWTMAELRLLEQGFSLATAEASGFAAAGEKIAAGAEEAELLEGVLVMPPTYSPPKENDPSAARIVFAQEPPSAPEWCVSYAWGEDTIEGRKHQAIVERFCAEAEAQGIRILRAQDEVGLGERISKFMKQLGRDDRVFVILSDKYLKSPFCMFELSEVWRTSRQEDEEFLRRICIYTLPCAKIWTPRDRAKYAIHWKQQHDELEALIKKHGYDTLGERDAQQLRRIRDFSRNVGDILATVADILQPRSFDELARYEFNTENEHNWRAKDQEARRVYDNLIKAFAFVLPTNLGLALILIVAVAFFPGPYLVMVFGIMEALQILWINLMAAVALALPLAMEAMEPNIMSRPPRRPDAPILSPFVITRTIIVAVLMAAGAIGLFLVQAAAAPAGSVDTFAEAQTQAVTTIIMYQIFYLLNYRSLKGSFLKVGLWSNPWTYAGIGTVLFFHAGFIYLPFMNAIFGSAPLSLQAWAEACAVGFLIMPVIAVEKWWRRKRGVADTL
jgi:hypothetical protein